MSSILVVESEGVISRLLRDAPEIDGFQTVMVLNGEDAVQFALREIPQLILLDATSTGKITALEAVRRLRAHPKSMHIPIIFLSATCTVAEKVQAFDLGVDNYIASPFHPDELLAQVRRHLRRTRQCSLSPLTQLPGGLQLERTIEERLRRSESWSALYLDLDNFKAFNDVYGFLAGNNMILLVSTICQRVLHEYGNADDFVGHIGGDDFVIMTTPDRARILCRHILERYKEQSAILYLPEDLERGSINGLDRKGRPYQFPLVSLSIGVVSNQMRCSHSIEELGSLVAEAKRCAKHSLNNVYYISSPRHDYSHTTSMMPSTAPLRFSDALGRQLWRITEREAFAEYK